MAMFHMDTSYKLLFYSLILSPVVYLFVSISYNLYFHPLARIPGPLWWRASRLSFIRSFVSGDLVSDVRKLHEIYGDVVRTAPDEVSFARDDVWKNVIGGRHPLPRDEVFFQPPPGQPDNLVMTTDEAASARMRQVVHPGFSERGLAKQEETMHYYVDLLVQKWKEQLRKGQSKDVAVLNIVDWFEWFAFDLVGDLTFGEAFHCLRDIKHHPWITTIFNTIKVMALVAATRYYAGLEAILLRLVPPSIRKIPEEHYAFALEKIHSRMTLPARDDFMAPMIENNPNFERMSKPEVESTSATLILAGSETTATTLSAIWNALVRNPEQLHKLEVEIRTSFEKVEDITLRSLQNLPFLNAVIYEGLRLYHPVAGGFPRSVPKGGSVVCGYFLPEGTHVLVNATAMSLSELNFYRAGEFLPSRFLPDNMRPNEFKNDNRNTQKPFGIGSRSCIGKSFAMAEMRLVIAKLVWTFDICMAPGEGVEWNNLKTYIIVEKKPINVVVKERSGKSE